MKKDFLWNEPLLSWNSHCTHSTKLTFCPLSKTGGKEKNGVKSKGTSNLANISPVMLSNPIHIIFFRDNSVWVIPFLSTTRNFTCLGSGIPVPRNLHLTLLLVGVPHPNYTLENSHETGNPKHHLFEKEKNRKNIWTNLPFLGGSKC